MRTRMCLTRTTRMAIELLRSTGGQQVKIDRGRACAVQRQSLPERRA
jgi:hypothetical protein